MTTFEQRLKFEIDRTTNSNHTSANPSADPNANGSASVDLPSASVDSNPSRARPIRVGEGVLYAELSHAIVGAAIEVHRHIGPGQLESVYQRALENELSRREVRHRAQVPIAMLYKGDRVGEFLADLIVDDCIIVELKAVTGFHAVHTAQVLSYLRSTNLRLGLVVNFNVPVLWRGVRRIVL